MKLERRVGGGYEGINGATDEGNVVREWGAKSEREQR